MEAAEAVPVRKPTIIRPGAPLIPVRTAPPPPKPTPRKSTQDDSDSNNKSNNLSSQSILQSQNEADLTKERVPSPECTDRRLSPPRRPAILPPKPTQEQISDDKPLPPARTTSFKEVKSDGAKAAKIKPRRPQSVVQRPPPLKPLPLTKDNEDLGRPVPPPPAQRTSVGQSKPVPKETEKKPEKRCLGITVVGARPMSEVGFRSTPALKLEDEKKVAAGIASQQKDVVQPIPPPRSESLKESEAQPVEKNTEASHVEDMLGLEITSPTEKRMSKPTIILPSKSKPKAFDASEGVDNTFNSVTLVKPAAFPKPSKPKTAGLFTKKTDVSSSGDNTCKVPEQKKVKGKDADGATNNVNNSTSMSAGSHEDDAVSKRKIPPVPAHRNKQNEDLIKLVDPNAPTTFIQEETKVDLLTMDIPQVKENVNEQNKPAKNMDIADKIKETLMRKKVTEVEKEKALTRPKSMPPPKLSLLGTNVVHKSVTTTQHVRKGPYGTTKITTKETHGPEGIKKEVTETKEIKIRPYVKPKAVTKVVTVQEVKTKDKSGSTKTLTKETKVLPDSIPSGIGKKQVVTQTKTIITNQSEKDHMEVRASLSNESHEKSVPSFQVIKSIPDERTNAPPLPIHKNKQHEDLIKLVNPNAPVEPIGDESEAKADLLTMDLEDVLAPTNDKREEGKDTKKPKADIAETIKQTLLQKQFPQKEQKRPPVRLKSMPMQKPKMFQKPTNDNTKNDGDLSDVTKESHTPDKDKAVAQQPSSLNCEPYEVKMSTEDVGIREAEKNTLIITKNSESVKVREEKSAVLAVSPKSKKVPPSRPKTGPPPKPKTSPKRKLTCPPKPLKSSVHSDVVNNASNSQDLMVGPRCRALFDFAGESTNDLSFNTGDMIELIAYIDSDWLRGQISDTQGMFPKAFVEIIEDLPHLEENQCQASGNQESSTHNLVTAVFDFKGQDGELTLKCGDKVMVLYQANSDWLYGNIDDKEGLFPSNFVDRIPTDLPSAPQDGTPVPSSVQDSNKPKFICEYIVKYAFMAEGDGELSLTEREIILVLDQFSNDWWKGKRLNGQVGIFPSAFVEKLNADKDAPKKLFEAKALYDFNGQEGEMSFKKGDSIIVVEEINSDWMMGQKGDVTGHFPKAFVEITST